MGRFCRIANLTFCTYDSRPQNPSSFLRHCVRGRAEPGTVSGTAQGTQVCHEPRVLPAHWPPREPSAGSGPCAQHPPGPPITTFGNDRTDPNTLC